MQIVVSYGWNTSYVSISSSMFYNCQNLPNYYSGSMTDVSMAYSYAYGGYMSSLSEFCVGSYDLWGIVGSTWEEFIYSKYNVYYVRYDASVQFCHKNNETVNIDCLDGWSIPDMEKFYEDLWNTGWFEYYESYINEEDEFYDEESSQT